MENGITAVVIGGGLSGRLRADDEHVPKVLAPVVLGPAQRIVDFPPLIPDGPASDFVKDVFPAAVKAGEALLGYPETGRLSDRGSPERYDRFARSRDQDPRLKELPYGQA
jgi:hypothetical protein